MLSEPLDGSFRTAPRDRRDVSFTWSGDLAGQGWGINPDLGGFRIFRAMEALRPDFFLCSGDTVYADGPLTETVTLPDGRTWRNLVTPAKSKVAETLDEFRGQFAYNLLDENLRAFAAQVPQLNQWDDHEVRNNWYPGQLFDDPRYTERSADVLAGRARQAFFEWLPIGAGGRSTARSRTDRTSTCSCSTCAPSRTRTTRTSTRTRSAGCSGPSSVRGSSASSRTSRATWKVIAIDLPLGLIVPDGATAFEGVAQGDPGAPLGRELEFADVLRFAHRRGIGGIVLLTADVHYTAAHHYDPSRAAVGDFDPFWEFVSGPLNAGAFGPNALDRDVRPGARVRERAAARQHLARRGLPVLRPCRGRRRAPA